MVYQGPSKACARCKQRHIKCDETRPSCRNCLKRQLSCPGYAPEPGIRFQDETSSTINQAQQRDRRPTKRSAGKEAAVVPKALADDIEAVALQFFFDNYATLGRGSESSRGLFELIVPIYSSTAPSSAMSAATSAVALTITSEWYGRVSEAPLARRHLGKALSLLRAALNNPVLSLKDDTMMAVLVLKFHDMLVACKNLKEVPEDHVNGAIALVKHRGISSFNSDTLKRMLQYVRHTAISSAIQRRTKLDLTSELWTDPESMLKTPSIDLDWIGVDVANLRASGEARRVLHYNPMTTTLDEKQTREVRYVREQAATLEIRLSMWGDRLSGHWRPVTISDTRGVDPSIGRYGRNCDVYPSAQIAHILNLHRDYCLLVLELLLRCEVLLAPDPNKCPRSHYATMYRNVVDELCASVPFLLGNRTNPGTVEEFSLTTDIKFLEHPDEAKANVENLEMDLFMNREQRSKSLLAQGPWRLHDNLCQVVRFANSEAGQAVGELLPPDQIEWLEQQIRRSLVIQRIEVSGKPPELRSKRSSAGIKGITGALAAVDSGTLTNIESSTGIVGPLTESEGDRGHVEDDHEGV